MPPGIFQSNLGSDEQKNYAEQSNQDVFEECLGAPVGDELALYAGLEQASLTNALQMLGVRRNVA